MDHNMTSHEPTQDDDSHLAHMVFHTGNDEFILFKAIRSNTDAHIGLACLVVFLMGFMLDGIKAAKTWAAYRLRQPPSAASSSSSKGSSGSGNSKDGSKGSGNSNTEDNVSFGRLLLAHLVQTALHTAYVILSYLLMLVIMTFNVWIFLAVVAGCSTGYFLFGWKQSFRVDVDKPAAEAKG